MSKRFFQRLIAVLIVVFIFFITGISKFSPDVSFNQPSTIVQFIFSIICQILFLKAEHLYPSVTKQSIDFQKILIFHTIQSMMEKSHKEQSKKQTEKSDKQLKILDLNI